MICLLAGERLLVAAQVLRHARDGLLAELVGLLDDGAEDGAAFDARQRLVLLVEADDLHLADLAGILAPR